MHWHTRVNQSERLTAILERLTADGSVAVTSVAHEFDVSAATIRRSAFARICRLTEVDELITDDGADPSQLRALRDAGLRVTLA